MKPFHPSLLLLLLLLSVLPASGPLRAAGTSVPDSLLNAAYIQRIYLRQPDRALQLLDAADSRRLPGMQPFWTDMLRAMCYEIKNESRLKEKYARRALEADSVRLVPRRKMLMTASLVDALEDQSKFEEAIRLCLDAVEQARRVGSIAEEGKMYLIMGRIYAGMNRLEESLEAFASGISLMESSEDPRVMAQLSTTYGELMTVLDDHGRMADAIATGRKRAKLIDRLAEKPGPPPGFVDRQRGYCYSKMANFLLKAGREAEAEAYCRRFLDTEFATDTYQRREIIPYMLQAGRYREALQLNDAAFARWHGDSISHSYLILLERYAQAYRGLRRHDRAYSFQRRISTLQDSLYTREQESRAQEYAAVFRLNEKELQLAEARLQAQRRNFLLGSSGIVLVLMAVLIATIGHNLNKTRKRNRIAVKQIDELLEQREKLRLAYDRLEALHAAKSAAPAPEAPPCEAEQEAAASPTSTEYTLFMRMERRLLEQKLFLQPKFGRNELLQISGINKNDLPRLLKQYAEASNVSDYLNRLRVEYAVKLMKEKPSLSINGVAQEANFNSHVTFYRAFYKTFGLSPTQYIKAHEE